MEVNLSKLKEVDLDADDFWGPYGEKIRLLDFVQVWLGIHEYTLCYKMKYGSHGQFGMFAVKALITGGTDYTQAVQLVNGYDVKLYKWNSINGWEQVRG